MHLREIEHRRPDMEADRATLLSFVERVKKAENAEETDALLAEFEAFFSRLTTESALIYLRFFTNTADPDRAADMAYVSENSPALDTIMSGLSAALLEAPARDALTKTLGPFYFERAAAHRRTTSAQNEGLQIEEQALVQKYMALVSQGTVDFEDKNHSLSGMTRFYADPARERRRAAMAAVNGWYEARAEELDGLFDRLVQNRTAQARNLGYQNYTELRYATRYGYGRKEIAAFRAHICKNWVPLVSKIKEMQRARLGIETFRMYDSPMRFPDGNPKLKVKRRAFIGAAQQTFENLSPEAGAYFKTLDESGMLDLFDRKGKASYAGFCLWLPDYKMDFIGARFSGDQADFEILAHEFGHAYASHRADKAGVRFLLRDAPQEIMETHSKAMELFAMAHAELFFDESDARRYRIKQLEYIPYFVTSVCQGDEFQHEIYDHPEMSPAQRNDVYARIYRKYNPYLDESDLPFASWGSQWQDTLVLYSMPFYFIDYALAQALALCLYQESRSNFSAAWTRYLKFMDAAGAMPLPALAQACGLPSPFDEGALDELADFLMEEREKLND